MHTNDLVYGTCISSHGSRHGGGGFLGETHAELVVVACSLASMFVAHQPAVEQEKLLMMKIRLCKHKDTQGDLQ